MKSPLNTLIKSLLFLFLTVLSIVVIVEATIIYFDLTNQQDKVQQIIKYINIL
jgi:sensor domain CHASE-containing protein